MAEQTRHHYNELPIGVIDGTNTSFALHHVQVLGTLRVEKNGLTEPKEFVTERQGAFILDIAPLPGDVIRCEYIGDE